MSNMPNEVQVLHDTLLKVPGVIDAEIHPRGLEGIDESMLSLPGEFADLPQVALRRRPGTPRELLLAITLRFEQSQTGWIGIEFLAWWVRDLSRTTQAQMRPLALPPKAYGTQLGRTLKFVIEYFLTLPDSSMAPALAKLKELSESLESSLRIYAEQLAQPTMMQPPDLASLTRCAEAGDIDAQTRLANLYARGSGVPQDLDLAFQWLRRAAESGHPVCVRRLGLCYRRGEGVEADAARAFVLFSKAADGGDATSMGLLADAYEFGKGTAPDPKSAMLWLGKGAEAGDPGSLATLGEYYEKGKGVPCDLQRALEFYTQAADQGLDAVRPAIERVRRLMRS